MRLAKPFGISIAMTIINKIPLNANKKTPTKRSGFTIFYSNHIDRSPIIVKDSLQILTLHLLFRLSFNGRQLAPLYIIYL